MITAFTDKSHISACLLGVKYIPGDDPCERPTADDDTGVLLLRPLLPVDPPVPASLPA